MILTSFTWRESLMDKSLNVCLHMNFILSINMLMQLVCAIILQAEQHNRGPCFCRLILFAVKGWVGVRLDQVAYCHTRAD